MAPQYFTNIARAVCAYTAASKIPCRINGGWATGKSQLAAAIAAHHTQHHQGTVWLVGETTESARELTCLITREPGQDHIVVMTAEDYLDAHETQTQPTMIVFDDADRYQPPQPRPHVEVVHLTNCSQSKDAPSHHPLFFELHTSRAAATLVNTMNRANLTGTAAVGASPTDVLRARRSPLVPLTTAITGWGLVVTLAGRATTTLTGTTHGISDDARSHVLARTAKIMAALDSTEALSVAGAPLHAPRAPRTAIALSNQRSGRPGRLVPGEEQLPDVPSLLEDLAAARPDVVLIAALDDDLEHLARLASTSRLGAVVIAQPGSLVHRTLRHVEIG
ncbi:hypothetical protein [Nocardioides sp.]|uniref:hypothetical protein n=1 Tax=Nocardioides sp. TaxID=35761 RepID=UPI00271A3EE2|nr:hypothetical protein [Nocardioides sp.]MDO9455232.1 hypothetical protein [Nocardioides sp.]